MAVTHRVRTYHALAHDNNTAENLTQMMNGTHHGARFNAAWSMNPHERIVAVHYVNGTWFVFTEELVMGPPK